MVLDEVKVFCEVAAHRSFSRGARAAGVTQSAASQRVVALEREVGTQLVDRSTRPLRLTVAGEAYYRGCRELVDRYEQLCEQLTGNGSQVGGEVTIAAIYSAGINLLNRVKSDFEAEHPRTTIHVDYLQPEAVYERVRQGQCDFGILSYPQSWRGLASIPLREEVMAVVCRADHPLAQAGGLDASDLAGQDMVGFDQNLPISGHIQRYLGRHGVRAAPVNSFDNIDTIKTYLADGGAVAILPQRTVRREVERGILAAVALRPQLVRPMGVVHPRLSEFRPLAKVVIEYLLNHQSDAPSPTAAARTAT